MPCVRGGLCVEMLETGGAAPTDNNMNHRNLQIAALLKGRSEITRYVVA